MLSGLFFLLPHCPHSAHAPGVRPRRTGWGRICHAVLQVPMCDRSAEGQCQAEMWDKAFGLGRQRFGLGIKRFPHRPGDHTPWLSRAGLAQGCCPGLIIQQHYRSFSHPEQRGCHGAQRRRTESLSCLQGPAGSLLFPLKDQAEPSASPPRKHHSPDGTRVSGWRRAREAHSDRTGHGLTAV